MHVHVFTANYTINPSSVSLSFNQLQGNNSRFNEVSLQALYHPLISFINFFYHFVCLYSQLVLRLKDFDQPIYFSKESN